MTISAGVDAPPVTDALAVGTTTVKIMIGQLTFELAPVVPGGFYRLRPQLIQAREEQERLLEHYRGVVSPSGSIEGVSSRILALDTLIRQTLDPSTRVPSQLIVSK